MSVCHYIRLVVLRFRAFSNGCSVPDRDRALWAPVTPRIFMGGVRGAPTFRSWRPQSNLPERIGTKRISVSEQLKSDCSLLQSSDFHVEVAVPGQLSTLQLNLIADRLANPTINLSPVRKDTQSRYHRGLYRKKMLYRRGVREFW